MVGRKSAKRLPKPTVKLPRFPLLENCDTDNPEEFALWALVGLPNQRGAPLPMPVSALRKVSQRLWDLGFRYHPELRVLKYKPPVSGDPHFLVSPGTWVPLEDEPEPDLTEETISDLDPEDLKKVVADRYGLTSLGESKVPSTDADMVPFIKEDGKEVMITRAAAIRWANARKSAQEHGGGNIT